METFLFKVLPAAVIFLVIYLYVQHRFNKGAVGESKVTRALKWGVRGKKLIINNAIIKHGNRSAEIDHILIARNGIFVIETKNYSGQVYGTVDQRQWTQVLNYGKTKHRFYNPIMQNNTHIIAIERLLKINNGIYSIIVFPKANIMTTLPAFVGDISNMKRVIRSKKEFTFSDEQIKAIYQTLTNHQQTHTVTRREHIKNVKAEQRKIAQNICPHCNAPLVIREGKYGKFYSCPNYPKCTFRKRL